MTALISACNEALAKIMKGQITSLDEESVEAQYCKMFAEPLLAEMADWTAWPDLIARATLAANATNDRASEWNYSYALPADFGEPIAIRETAEDANRLPLVTQPYTLPVQDRYPLGFIIEGGNVYTNVENAILVYSKKVLEAGEMTALMRRAFVDELAARLAAPVGKLSANRISALMNTAMMSRERAIADAENKNPRQEPNYVSLAQYAREGVLE